MARTTGGGEWIYCMQCKMLDYPVDDKSTNHSGHQIHKFKPAPFYVAPIAWALMKLDTENKLTHNDLVMFKLAISLHGDDPKEWLKK